MPVGLPAGWIFFLSLFLFLKHKWSTSAIVQTKLEKAQFSLAPTLSQGNSDTTGITENSSLQKKHNSADGGG